MRRITVTLDSDEVERILRAEIRASFPDMEIEELYTHFPYTSDINIRLRAKDIADASILPAAAPPPSRSDEVEAF